MEMHEVEAVFEEYAADFLFEKFRYQLYVSGLFDQLEESEVLLDFLEAYSFDEKDLLNFDEFRYFFKTFMYFHGKNKLASDSWQSYF
ncbi:hypothetical protein D0469_17270 [Peribacillus saganii]|uniref:EF-hand domain-containing protein n=1 Tax=Peribacillus saganii TaxID=2303992 RepID=A0A372LK33_9BACI|nr:hypothetical protein [Peribacillus saganii]RFU66384.1 hypothetical protein D0469_17270 [Peribacillus saganii]